MTIPREWAGEAPRGSAIVDSRDLCANCGKPLGAERWFIGGKSVCVGCPTRCSSATEPTERPAETATLQLLTEILAELKHLRAAGQTGAVSSVEVKTSARGVDTSVKSYVGSDIAEAEQAALDSYFRVLEEVQRRAGVKANG